MPSSWRLEEYSDPGRGWRWQFIQHVRLLLDDDQWLVKSLPADHFHQNRPQQFLLYQFRSGSSFLGLNVMHRYAHVHFLALLDERFRVRAWGAVVAYQLTWEAYDALFATIDFAAAGAFPLLE